ncbi:hypothetical protein WP1_205 [Pseudomonas phage WP1]
MNSERRLTALLPPVLTVSPMILVRTDINSSRSLGLIPGRKRLRCSLRLMFSPLPAVFSSPR